jgi:hypothetical protein
MSTLTKKQIFVPQFFLPLMLRSVAAEQHAVRDYRHSFYSDSPAIILLCLDVYERIDDT